MGMLRETASRCASAGESIPCVLRHQKLRQKADSAVVPGSFATSVSNFRNQRMVFFSNQSAFYKPSYPPRSASENENLIQVYYAAVNSTDVLLFKNRLAQRAIVKDVSKKVSPMYTHTK